MLFRSAFGLGGALLICVIQPVFNKYYHRLTIKMRIALCIIFTLIFIADAAHSAMLPNTGEYIIEEHITTARPCIFRSNHLI